MAKRKKNYVITFGDYNTETKHVFPKKNDAVAKANELKLKFPHIGNIKVKKNELA